MSWHGFIHAGVTSYWDATLFKHDLYLYMLTTQQKLQYWRDIISIFYSCILLGSVASPSDCPSMRIGLQSAFCRTQPRLQWTGWCCHGEYLSSEKKDMSAGPIFTQEGSNINLEFHKRTPYTAIFSRIVYPIRITNFNNMWISHWIC